MKRCLILLAFVTATAAFSQTQVTIRNDTGALQGTVKWVAFPPGKLRLLDTDQSHTLTIANGSDMTANRTLTLIPGDADRTLTLTGNATLNQDVSSSATPTFEGIVSAAGAADQFKFARGDGTFQSLPGGGNMLAANNLGDVQSTSNSRANIEAQKESADLDGVTAITGAAIVVRVAPGQWIVRQLTAGTGVTVTNGDGIAGNMVVAIGQSVGTTSSPLFANVNIPNGGGVLGAGDLQIRSDGTGTGITISGATSGAHTNNLFVTDAAGSAVNIGSAAGNISIGLGGDTAPRANASFDLGSSGMKFRHGYFAGDLVTGTLKIGTGGSVVGSIVTATGTVDYGSIAGGAEETATLTVSGASEVFTDSVELGWSGALPDGIVVKQAWVSSSNTVSIRVANYTVDPIDPAAVTCRVTLIQY